MGSLLSANLPSHGTNMVQVLGDLLTLQSRDLYIRVSQGQEHSQDVTTPLGTLHCHMVTFPPSLLPPFAFLLRPSRHQFWKCLLKYTVVIFHGHNLRRKQSLILVPFF